MLSFTQAKAMARTLRREVERDGMTISHSRSLEIVAHQFGLKDWNVMAARIAEDEARDVFATSYTAPIMRIFDEEKAREFYLDFLGFTVKWEHRFGENFPLYAEVARGGLVLHLSGHHGDATPGNTVFAAISGIEAYHRELAGKDYRHMKPGVEKVDWGLEMTVTDPFGNRIRFCEQRRSDD